MFSPQITPPTLPDYFAAAFDYNATPYATLITLITPR
jgi:hypothetical protein